MNMGSCDAHKVLALLLARKSFIIAFELNAIILKEEVLTTIGITLLRTQLLL